MERQGTLAPGKRFSAADSKYRRPQEGVRGGRRGSQEFSRRALPLLLRGRARPRESRRRGRPWQGGVFRAGIPRRGGGAGTARYLWPLAAGASAGESARSTALCPGQSRRIAREPQGRTAAGLLGSGGLGGKPRPCARPPPRCRCPRTDGLAGRLSGASGGQVPGAAGPGVEASALGAGARVEKVPAAGRAALVGPHSRPSPAACRRRAAGGAPASLVPCGPKASPRPAWQLLCPPSPPAAQLCASRETGCPTAESQSCVRLRKAAPARLFER